MNTCLRIGTLLCLPFAVLGQPVQTQLLHGHRPAAALSLAPVGRLEPSRELKLAIGLPLRNKEGLTNLLQRIYDPASPDYHNYLTPAQFAGTFGPTEEDYHAVTAFAIAHGLKVVGTHSNRTLLDVTGTVSNIEKTLHLTLRTYAHPREYREFFAPDAEPSLDLATPILHVSGLDNYLQPHPMVVKKSLSANFGAMVSATGSGPSGTFMGGDFRAAYIPGTVLAGAGQSVGLLEFDGYYPSDISTYASTAGIASVPLTNVYLDGFNGAPGANNTEVALDIDMAVCMAPGLSSVLVYEGEAPDDILNRMATDDLASQLSASWAYPIDTETEQIFQQFAAQGQSFFNSSGDSDAWVGTITSPCDDPNITIVGGTTLTTSGPGGVWVSETVWNRDVEYGSADDGVGGSGGISTTYPIPTWQMAVSMTANAGSTRFRNVPDVALTAENIFVVADNGQNYDVGGTSCAAPLWAGFVALANEQAAAKDLPKIGFINPAVYALGLSANYGDCFHDTTNGNNTWSKSQSLFYAVPGYDLCTGWGTPMGSNLVNLIGPLDVLQISPLAVWDASGAAGGPLTPASQTYTLTNSGNIALQWQASVSVPWISLSVRSGTLTPGGPSTTVVASLNAAASNLAQGTYSGTIRFPNLTDGTVQSRPVSLVILSPPVITAQPTNLAVIGGSTASFTAGVGGSLPLNCQWQYNGVNVTLGGGVSVFQNTTMSQSNSLGSVTSTLTISNVSAADVGSYALSASNVAGVAVSSNAVLTLTPSGPIIVQQPASQTVQVGAQVQFGVLVDGSAPFVFQWQQNGTNLEDGGAIAGSATSVLTISGASSASPGTYAVVVSNILGTATSTGAVLSVQVAASGQPLVQNGGFETGSFSSWSESGNFVNCSVSTNPPAVYSGLSGALLGPPGSLAFLSQSLPTVAGQPYLLSFWLDSPDGLTPNEFLVEWNGTVLFDQTNLAAIGWTNLQFYVTGAGSNTVLEFGFRDDNSALGLDDIQVIPLVSALGAPIIATQPANQVSLLGGTATFNVLSAGQLPLFYQWQFEGTNIAGATNATLDLANLTSNQAGTYGVLVSNSLGTALSTNAQLTVLTGSSELITFDDLPYRFTPVPTGYGSLNWSNFYYLNGVVSPPSGYNSGMVSVPKVAYNSYGALASVSASTPFAFLSAYLTGAWNQNLQVQVQGYNGSTLIYDHTYTLSATNPTLITFNYVGVTSVQFISYGGAPFSGYNGSGTEFVLDNVSVNVAPAPLPSSGTNMAVLYDFDGFDGSSPSSTLVQGADGNFYGTTEFGGTYGFGTVFKMTTNGNLAVLFSFNSSNANPYGALMQGTDGKLYGTTEYGGTNDNGTVFSLTTNGAFSTLASFSYNLTGGYPSTGLAQGLDGNFYGTTANGGANLMGTVFKMTTNGTLTTLVAFNRSNGSFPYDALTLGPDGSLYGATLTGGVNGAGTIFKITTNGALTTLLSINGSGTYPYGPLTLGANGNFYGTTEYGGTNGDGTIFSLTTNGLLTTLASFNNDVTGGYPTSGLVQGPDGNFYGTTGNGGTFGTTYYNGTYGGGTVYKLTTNGTLTALLSFENTNGLFPEAGLALGTDGYLYGSTYYGGTAFNGINYSGDGVLFRIGTPPAYPPPAIVAQPFSQLVPAGGAVSFSVNATGAAPLNYSWLRNGSPIAGATQSAYTNNNVRVADSGSQFSCVISNGFGLITSSNAQLTVFDTSGPLFAFHGFDGGTPSSALVQGADGNFYGTTEYGGTNGDGSVFSITTNGTLTTLASFNYYVTGANPWTGLALGPDGNFYGTTIYGGAHDQGTVFSMTADGILTPLISFNSTDGAQPYGGLTLGANGKFYGTTYYGGKFGGGTMFSITTNGTFTSLVSSEGLPFSTMALGADGNFYGTTVAGGTYSYGTVFKLQTNGALTTLVSFNSTNGAYPYGGLIQGADGNFYGTTEDGGIYSYGTVFRMTTNGILTSLFSFAGTKGFYPQSGLVQAADGNFYGTTTQGGMAGAGTAFSITTNGILTTLFSFAGANGSLPNAALLQGSDGSFYGTTSSGGLGYNGNASSGNGTVFRLVGAFTKEPPMIVTQPVSQTAPVGADVSFSASVESPGPFSYQWQFDGTNYLSPVAEGILTTVAGDGTQGYSGDSGAATNAELSSPHAVAMDANGNLFIADSANERIRQVGINGNIATVAGDGTNGYSGDGGMATNADLSQAYGVAVDAFGNLFIADTGNQRVRQVGTNGLITTVAGNGTPGFSGDGGTGTNASLNNPSGVAVDAFGNLFIADTYNFRIRKLGTNGLITTVAGNGTGGYSGDGGMATNASLNYPMSVAVDAFGDLFIADAGNNRIREVNAVGIITTVAGVGASGHSGDGGAATNAQLNNPTAVAVDAAGDVFMADLGNHCIRETDTNGIITTVAGNGTAGYSGDGGSAISAELHSPAGLVVGANGAVLISDTGNERIRQVILQGPTLLLTNVALGAAGSYDVVVSNAYGSVTSSVATLMVGFPPAITSPPANLALMQGDTATFSVTATGTAPLSYLWQFDGTDLPAVSQKVTFQGDVLTITNVTPANAGTYQVIVSNSYGLVSASATLMVQAITILTWTNPVPITYGAALTSNQLNATTSAPGSFAYDPTNGTFLDAGTYTLSVIFTPNDPLDFSGATNFVELVVLPAPLTATAANATVSYGQAEPLFTGVLTGVTNGDNITATYSCSATANSPAGTYPIVSALMDPANRQTNYAVTLVNGTLTIAPAVPALVWTNPASITYGAPLTSNQLNATANVPGNFAFNPTNGTFLNTGTNTLSVIFTPADSVDFSSVTNMVSLVVLPAPLIVTASNASKLYGQPEPLFAGAITGVTNGDNITATYSCSATTNSPVGTYSIVPALMDPDHRQTNYTVTLVNGTLTIVTGVPLLAWTNPAPITYGASLTSNQLNATASVPGSFAYFPTNGAVLNTGTNTLSVIFMPNDAVDFSNLTNMVNLLVLPASLTVTASNASKVYGKTNPVFAGVIAGVTNGDNITATYSCSATTNSPVGTYPIVPALVDPDHRQTNYAVTLDNGTLTITKAAPVLVWTNPVPIIYGTALASNQLNATAKIPGSFAYLPTNGTYLNTGTNKLRVIFTPSNTVDYSIVTNKVNLVVLPAPLMVTASNASKPYGQVNPVFMGAIIGVTNGDNITATYTCSATATNPVGTYPIVPSLVDPNNSQTNYLVTLVNGTLTITGIPVLAWTPTPITYGAALGSNQLNATTSVPGGFAYNPTNDTFLNAGTNTLSVVFTPADTVDFSSVTNFVNLVVSPAPLTVTASNATKPYGQADAVFTGTITGVTNGDNITATYSCSATATSPVGTYPIVPSLVDPANRQTNYAVTLVNGTLTINTAVPVLTWTNPAPTTYGAPLNSNQLNATANVPGNFSYNPTNGAFLNTGTNRLCVIFTPADAVDFISVTNFVKLVVSPAPLTVMASNATVLYGQPEPLLTGVITGVTNGDNITATFSCSATSTNPVGAYPIVPSLLDPDNRQTNYTVTLVNGTLTIVTAAPVLAWTNPASITYGAPLTSNQLNATANVPGNFAFNPTNGTVLNTGTNTLSVIFTPADTVDFISVTNTVSLVVSPATLTVTASNVTEPYGQIEPLFTGTIAGVTNGDNITATYSCSATATNPVGTYPIVPSLVDPNNRQTNYTVTLVNGTLTIAMAVPALVWTNPVPITYGAPLTSNQLNATANVPGNFAYYPTNGTFLNAGTNTLNVIFTPADAVDFSSVTNSVSLVMLPAPLIVMASNASEPYGQADAVFTGSITGVTNGDNITATYTCSATATSPAGNYPIVPVLVDPDNRQTNYAVTLVNGTLTISGTPVLTWIPIPITYGAALGSNQLNATASVPGSFTYKPTNGAFLKAGTNRLYVIFTPADTVDFSTVTNHVNLVVSPAPLTVTASNATVPYGQPEPFFTGVITGVTNGDNITANYSCSAATNSPVGTYPIVPSLVDPNNRQTNYTVTLINGTLTIVPAGLALTWTNPASITYGAPLTSNQLNATANVPGNFTFNPTNGAVLNTGTNTLSVIFTPSDMVDFSSVTNIVSLVVLPAPLTVTASNATVPYGQPEPLFTGTITGVTNGDNITATYTCSATATNPVGTYPIVPALVDPNNSQTNYTVTLINGTLTITGAPVLAWTPIPITYGAALGSNQLNPTTSVPGSFIFFPTNGTFLNAGTNTLTVIFTPADTVDFSSVTNSVGLVVSPAPLTVTASNATEPFGQPEPLFTGTITGVTNGDNITATYSCSATNNSPVGTYPIVPALVDPNNRQTNYTVTLVNGTLTITGTPILTWSPTPITYGAALGSNQLNATTSVPGSFTYNPTNGTFLNAGTNTLSVIFTPSDTVDFSTVTNSVGLVVSRAPLTVTASNASEPFGQSDAVFTGTITGLTNGDNITATYSCSATNNSPAGTYPIVPALVDPQDRQTNYSVTLVNGTLTVIALPQIQSVRRTGSSFIFTWSATSNQMYQIQSKTGLNQPTWTTVGGILTATNSTLSVSESIGTNTERFYRVVLLP